MMGRGDKVDDNVQFHSISLECLTLRCLSSIVDVSSYFQMFTALKDLLAI